MTAVFCVLYFAAFELCIQSGLIRCNTGYGELFRASSLGAQITDRDDNICLSSNDAAPLSMEQIAEAEQQPVLIDGTLLLKSKPIRFGHVLWHENIAELTEAIEDIEENCRDLAERNRLREENLNARRQLLTLQEKNRVNDLLHMETAGQIDLIDRLLSGYDGETDEVQRKQFLAGAAVVGAYIKRYGNLLLVHERSGIGDIRDLGRCFEESFLNLEILGVECLCSLPENVMLGTGDMLRIYRAFEEILETCLFDLRNVWVKGRDR